MKNKTAISLMKGYSSDLDKLSHYKTDKSYEFSGLLGLIINRVGLDLSFFRGALVFSLFSLLFIISSGNPPQNEHYFTNNLVLITLILTILFSGYVLIMYELSYRKKESELLKDFKKFFETNFDNFDFSIDKDYLHKIAKSISKKELISKSQDEALTLFKTRLIQSVKEPL